MKLKQKEWTERNILCLKHFNVNLVGRRIPGEPTASILQVEWI